MSQKQNSSSSEEPKPVPMEQPLKKHGDKIHVGSADNEDAPRQAAPANRRLRRWNLRNRVASVAPSLPVAALIRTDFCMHTPTR